MRTAIISTLFVTLLASPALGSENAVPWWKQQKIRFMWGTWPHVDKHFRGSLYYWSSDLPREFFRNIAQAGATVFTEVRGYKPEHARFAHGFGLKYFATLYPAYLHHGHGHGGGLVRVQRGQQAALALGVIASFVFKSGAEEIEVADGDPKDSAKSGEDTPPPPVQ